MSDQIDVVELVGQVDKHSMSSFQFFGASGDPLSESLWLHSCNFLLGEPVPMGSAEAGVHLRYLLRALMDDVRVGCCREVAPGQVCGGCCFSSCEVGRISRAIALSLHDLPEGFDITDELRVLRDVVAREERVIRLVYRREISQVFPSVIRKLILEGDSCGFASSHPWSASEWCALLEVPGSWVGYARLLSVLGYPVVVFQSKDVLSSMGASDLRRLMGSISHVLRGGEGGSGTC